MKVATIYFNMHSVNKMCQLNPNWEFSATSTQTNTDCRELAHVLASIGNVDTGMFDRRKSMDGFFPVAQANEIMG